MKSRLLEDKTDLFIYFVFDVLRGKSLKDVFWIINASMSSLYSSEILVMRLSHSTYFVSANHALMFFKIHWLELLHSVTIGYLELLS